VASAAAIELFCPKQFEEAAKRTHASVNVRQFIDAPFFPNKKADFACPLRSDTYAAAHAGLAFRGSQLQRRRAKTIYLMPHLPCIQTNFVT
jgi:hypothetical protein